MEAIGYEKQPVRQEPTGRDVEKASPFSQEWVTLSKQEHIALTHRANYWEAQYAQLKQKLDKVEAESQRKDAKIKESDRIILGDFNDNPFATDDDGDPRYSDFLYQYMAWKKYDNLVSSSTGYTRMDANLSSIIDHVLANNSARRHLESTTVTKYLPPDASPAGLATWRETYSDHLPLIVRLKVEDEDDDVDFE